MVIKLLFMVLLASSALSKNIPRYSDLDEEDQLLFRAAYDSPPYEEEEYQETEEPSKLDKLVLLKDGMWALKSKMKDLKVFDKALAANLLATKLQVKQMLGALKKHQHVEKKKPVYHYQSPPPAYHQYEAPHYAPPPEHHYSPPQSATQYNPPQHAPPKYDPPAHYEAQSYAYPAPPKYETPSHYDSQSYVPPPHKYEPPVHHEEYLGAPTKYGPQQYPQIHIEAPQYAPQAGPYGHDPYYGY